MAKEIKTVIDGIRDLRIKAKVGEDKDGNKKVVSAVSFECDASPKEFDGALQALAAGHQLDAMIASPQMAMDIE